MKIQSWLYNRLLGAGITLLMVGSAPAMAGEVLDRVMKRGKLVNSTDLNYPPHSWLDKNNEIVGFDVDVAREIARRLGAELELVTPSWEVVVSGRWNDRFDICVCSMTETKARAEVVDFAGIYKYAMAVAVVNKNNTSITKVEDLNGKRVGAEAGSIYESYLRETTVIDVSGVPPVTFKIDNPEIIAYDSQAFVEEDLALGDGVRLDGIVISNTTANDAITKGRPLRIVEEGNPLFMEPVSVAIEKGDPEFATKIEETLDAMRADGFMKETSEKFFSGLDITQVPDFNN